MKPYLRLLLLICLAGLACNLPQSLNTPISGGAVEPEIISTAPVLSDTPTQQAVSTEIPPTLTPTIAPTATPFGCLHPPDDYTRVAIYESIEISQRTLFMLQHAQDLYGGPHDLVKAMTQGSYSTGVSASFGTHDGGGAVDISVRDLGDWHHIVTEDFDAIILALRQAGFAAWIRDTDELYAGSPIHIHAIAIGDAELSEAAARQLDGVEGYFRGFNGLPVDPPLPDGYGEPIICQWMLDIGYSDLRGE